ncbi:hypothetical protein [Streptomyces lonarensis]|uniref:Uncharacterized protein n=1 Tax=Streptomyces lonarensis TaxID=700599 RepID=A0A7X6CYT3_9ACTN|nr:hypothetical protein [Streptomyces lonarensis]NJQ05058.1 hypothetical protein [Streptomyces lonarensis]
MFEDISFANSDREEAEDAARELFNHVKELGVRLDDIDVLDPCDGCRRSGYLVHLGNLTTDDVAILNTALRTRPATSP